MRRRFQAETPQKNKRQRGVSYARVSTTRQADHGLSLDEQNRKNDLLAQARDIDLVRSFVDRGVSGRTDSRPEFQAMVQFACDPDNRVDVVIVYNFSRFFRGVTEYLAYKRNFHAAGVRLLSATQDIPDGPAGDLMETILAAFDGHASEVNAEAVRDVMVANAESGFWNGARPPYGYHTETVMVLRKKEKKKLRVYETEAVIVRKIYEWCLHGDGSSGPMGIKAIATRLNSLGYRMRGERLFYTSVVETILTSETYAGTAYYNKRDSRTGELRPPCDWIRIDVPPIVDREVYDAVQRILAARAPTKTPPRVVNGPTLLTGLAKCDCCTSKSGKRSGMMLRTGKGGRYRYLVCANRATKATFACNAPPIRMDKVDELVLSQLEARVFAPARLRKLLAAMIDQSEHGKASLDAEIERQSDARRRAESGLRNLYAAVATAGDTFSLDDPLFREQVQNLKLQVSELTTSIQRLKERLAAGSGAITDSKLSQFSKAIRRRLRECNPTFRRQWLHLFVDEVIIGKDDIIVRGQNDLLFSALRSDEQFVAPMVPTFAREWRARKDSNL